MKLHNQICLLVALSLHLLLSAAKPSVTGNGQNDVTPSDDARPNDDVMPGNDSPRYEDLLRQLASGLTDRDTILFGLIRPGTGSGSADGDVPHVSRTTRDSAGQRSVTMSSSQGHLSTTLVISAEGASHNLPSAEVDSSIPEEAVYLLGRPSDRIPIVNLDLSFNKTTPTQDSLECAWGYTVRDYGGQIPSELSHADCSGGCHHCPDRWVTVYARITVLKKVGTSLDNKAAYVLHPEYVPVACACSA